MYNNLNVFLSEQIIVGPQKVQDPQFVLQLTLTHYTLRSILLTAKFRLNTQFFYKGLPLDLLGCICCEASSENGEHSSVGELSMKNGGGRKMCRSLDLI